MENTAEKINKEFTFGELLQKYPEAGQILLGYGLHCVGCQIGITETIEQGAKAHGLDDSKIESLLNDLNNNLINK